MCVTATSPPAPLEFYSSGVFFFVFMSINMSMIQVCPNCGHALQRGLSDGLTHCSHCNQVFDSSDYNRLLSAAWQIRKEHLSLEQVKWQLNLGDDFSILVFSFVNDHGYSHEEFMKVLKKLGVANKAYISLDRPN